MEHNVIIVEGADKVGKSTVIQALKQQAEAAGLKVGLMKFSGPPPDDPDPSLTQRRKFEDGIGHIELHQDAFDLVVLDRSYVGEYVYAEISGRQYPHYIRDMHIEHVRRFNPLYVLIEGRQKGDIGPTDWKGRHGEITERFERFFAAQRQKMLSFSTDTSGSAYEIAASILNVANNGYPSDPVFSNKYSWTCRHPIKGWAWSDIPMDSPHYKHHVALWGHEPIAPQVPEHWELAVFGEAPGRFGCGISGIPLYLDKSGTLFRRAMFSLGLNPDLMFMSNVFHTTPPDNKLKVPLEHMSTFNYLNPMNGNPGIEEWERQELRMFAADLVLAARRAGTVIACGRYAHEACRTADAQLNLHLDIIPLYHPAYYLYRGEPAQIFTDYRARLKAGGIEVLPE